MLTPGVLTRLPLRGLSRACTKLHRQDNTAGGADIQFSIGIGICSYLTVTTSSQQVLHCLLKQQLLFELEFALTGNSQLMGGCMHYPKAHESHDQVVKDRDLFSKALSNLHKQMGIQSIVPHAAGKPVDLHLLYKEVRQAPVGISTCLCMVCIIIFIYHTYTTWTSHTR